MARMAAEFSWKPDLTSTGSRMIRSVSKRVDALVDRLEEAAERTSSAVSSLATMSVGALELQASKQRRRARLLLLLSLVSVVSYILLGAYFFHTFEPDGWSFTDSLYFCVVSISTCGFGDMSPSSPLTKAFNTVYVLFGVSSVFVQLSSFLAAIQSLGVQTVQLRLARTHGSATARKGGKTSTADAPDAVSSSSPSSRSPQSALRFYVSNLSAWLVVFSLIQFGCALPYWMLLVDPTGSRLSAAELSAAANATFPGLAVPGAGVPYLEGLYFGWITALTIGYGSTPTGVPTELALQPAWYRPYLTFHILISTSALGGLIAHISKLWGERAAQAQQAQLSKLELTDELIEQLDRDGNGVDRLEFVIGMLSELGLAYWHDVKPLLDLFDSFDRDQSGTLNREDVQLQLAAHRSGRPLPSPPQQQQRRQSTAASPPAAAAYEGKDASPSARPAGGWGGPQHIVGALGGSARYFVSSVCDVIDTVAKTKASEEDRRRIALASRSEMMRQGVHTRPRGSVGDRSQLGRAVEGLAKRPFRDDEEACIGRPAGAPHDQHRREICEHEPNFGGGGSVEGVNSAYRSAEREARPRHQEPSSGSGVKWDPSSGSGVKWDHDLIDTTRGSRSRRGQRGERARGRTTAAVMSSGERAGPLAVATPARTQYRL